MPEFRLNFSKAHYLALFLFRENLWRQFFVGTLSCVRLWNISSPNIFSTGVIALPSALFPLRILIKGLSLTCRPTFARPCCYGASNKSISCVLSAYLLRRWAGDDRARTQWPIGTTPNSHYVISRYFFYGHIRFWVCLLSKCDHMVA